MCSRTYCQSYRMMYIHPIFKFRCGLNWLVLFELLKPRIRSQTAFWGLCIFNLLNCSLLIDYRPKPSFFSWRSNLDTGDGLIPFHQQGDAVYLKQCLPEILPDVSRMLPREVEDEWKKYRGWKMKDISIMNLMSRIHVRFLFMIQGKFRL